MNRQQQRVLRQMIQSNIDPTKPYQYVNGQFVQTIEPAAVKQEEQVQLHNDAREETSEDTIKHAELLEVNKDQQDLKKPAKKIDNKKKKSVKEKQET